MIDIILSIMTRNTNSESAGSSICLGLRQRCWHRPGRFGATGRGNRFALLIRRHCEATANLPLCGRQDSGPHGSAMPVRRLIVPSWALHRTDTQRSSECLPRTGLLRVTAAPAKTAFLRSASAQPLRHRSGVDSAVMTPFQPAESLRWSGIPVRTAPLKAACAASPISTPLAPGCTSPCPEATS